MSARRRFLFLLLAALLVFGQHASIAHALSHYTSEAGSPDKHAPLSPACEKCAATSALDAAAVPTSPSVAPPRCDHSVASGEFRSRPQAPPAAYQSRAPPASCV